MPTKTPRRTRAELREMMLEAGTEVLVGLTPDLGFEHLTYGAVFDHLLATRDTRVTIGSVHERIWSGQREFQLDVLARAIAHIPEDGFDNSYAGIDEAEAAADLTTLKGRRHAFQNALRLSRAASWKATEDYDPAEVLAINVRLRLWSLPDDHPDARNFFETIRHNRERNRDLYIDLLKSRMKTLNLRVRPGIGDPDEVVASLIETGSAIATGYLVDTFDRPNNLLRLPTGPNGEIEEWTPLGRAVYLLFRGALEFADHGLSPADRMV